MRSSKLDVLKLAPTIYAWSRATQMYADPSVTRSRNDLEYVTTLQKLVLSIIVNKEILDAAGHSAGPRWLKNYLFIPQ